MDVRGNKVKLDDDTEISYDKCLIATGKKKKKSFAINYFFNVVETYASFSL